MNTENKDEVVYLYLDDIIPNRFQPREVFDERALKELAISIKEHGVIQPIIVRSVNGKYEIIAGERRYKASALAGMTKIPAIIRNLDDKESSKVALLENLQRRNLNPIEEARTYQKILEIDQMTQEELAKTMGKSQSAVANKLRLLSLPDEIQDSLLKEQISERHARALLNVPDSKSQSEMLKKIINNKMTVRALEEEINRLYPKDGAKKEGDSDKMNDNSASISANFINPNPLTPTAAMPEDTSNYGKVTIAPPYGEKPDYTPKFINYGEIKEDEESNNNDLPFKISPPVDIETVKQNTSDIQTSSSSGAALDNLLNIQVTPKNNTDSSTISSKNLSNNFLTPAEAIVKTDENIGEKEVKKDYFPTPDFKTIGFPMGNTNIKAENDNSNSPNSLLNIPKPIMQTSSDTNMVGNAINRIKNLVPEIEQMGLKISLDEMNFEKSIQIIIKIDKPE